MIFNKSDFKDFIQETKDLTDSDITFYPGRLSWFLAGLIDYLFHGGQICNKHDKWLCRKCKPKMFCYAPDFSLKERVASGGSVA